LSVKLNINSTNQATDRSDVQLSVMLASDDPFKHLNAVIADLNLIHWQPLKFTFVMDS